MYSFESGLRKIPTSSVWKDRRLVMYHRVMTATILGLEAKICSRQDKEFADLVESMRQEKR
jgi:hypothetical protein